MPGIEKLGKIEVSQKAIASIAADAVLRSYGVVGMASARMKDGLAELLRREHFERGVVVRLKDGQVTIDLYVVIEYGTRVSEVGRNIAPQREVRRGEGHRGAGGPGQRQRAGAASQRRAEALAPSCHRRLPSSRRTDTSLAAPHPEYSCRLTNPLCVPSLSTVWIRSEEPRQGSKQAPHQWQRPAADAGSGGRPPGRERRAVNALNVFPVPDGDTGTNMLLTMQSALEEVARVTGDDVSVVAHAAAHGSLMGARGNSGVILSQLLRGIARASDGKESLDSAELAAALKEGANTAYRGIGKTGGRHHSHRRQGGSGCGGGRFPAWTQPGPGDSADRGSRQCLSGGDPYSAADPQGGRGGRRRRAGIPPPSAGRTDVPDR